MKIIWKILKYIIAISISIVLILFILSILFEKDISRIFISELNKKINTSIKVEELNFSLLRRFPQASIELDNILIESPASDSMQFRESEIDSLLYAEKMILSLNLPGLLKKNYVIDRIDIRKGNLKLYRNLSGELNTSIFKRDSINDTVSIKLDINELNIISSSYSYVSESGFTIKGGIKNAYANISLNDNFTNLNTKAELNIEELKTSGDYNIKSVIPLSVSSGVNIFPDSMLFRDSDIVYENISFSGSANLYPDSKRLKLDIQNSPGQISLLRNILPPAITRLIDEYSIDGNISGRFLLNGKYTKRSDLALNAEVELGDNSLSMQGQKDIFLTDINGAVRFSTNFRDSRKYFSAESQSFTARTANTPFSGSFKLTNLEKPSVDLIISGSFPSAFITDLAAIEGLESSSGKIRVNARLNGTLPESSGEAPDRFLNLNRSVNLGFNSVNINIPGLSDEIMDLNGNIMIANNIWVDNLSLVYDDQYIAMNAMVNGFNGWLAKESDNLNITAGIWSDRLDISALRNSIILKGGDSKSRNTSLSLNLNMSCDSMIVNEFRASLFEGNLTYIPGLIDIPSFSMNALGGSLSGNAAIANLKESGYALRGWFDIEDIDIHETFIVFNDFSQEYIRSENLEGILTGRISLSASSDKDFRINRKDLMLNGEYAIIDGKLLDFEPAYKLSRFIEIEELESIYFSRLENDLIINDEMIIIPRMDISSSAFNISLEGNHSFNGNYEYHLNVLLSEILSRRENKKVNEFGVIEDDGLGRTSLYLLVQGDKGGSRVSHDMAALSAGIRKDLQEEKKTIKSILNEEYGWYKSDSLPEIEPEKTRRFRIVWEETDSIKTEIDKTNEKTLPLIRLFKKRNKKGEKTEKR